MTEKKITITVKLDEEKKGYDYTVLLENMTENESIGILEIIKGIHMRKLLDLATTNKPSPSK